MTPLRERIEMDPNRSLLMIVPTAVMLGIAAYAHAQPAPTVVAPTVITSLNGAAAEATAQQALAQAQLQDAVRDLERAVLQWDFKSSASELALLQHAHDRLNAAVNQLRGAQRKRALELLADLDHAVQRASSLDGPLSRLAGETVDPRAPSRNQLAQLATEGQDLERSAPTAHRLLDGSGLRMQHRRGVGAQQPPGPIPSNPADADLPSRPLETETAWPQFHVRF